MNKRTNNDLQKTAQNEQHEPTLTTGGELRYTNGFAVPAPLGIPVA
jgi:hypothetical protein